MKGFFLDGDESAEEEEEDELRLLLLLAWLRLSINEPLF